MISLLKNWKGSVDINGKHYNSISEVLSDTSELTSNTSKDEVVIKLSSNAQTTATEHQSIVTSDDTDEYTITVKQYMTKKATPDFDFMEKWNKNIPMPIRTMSGTIEKQTRGMVYMKLHGPVKPNVTCLCCGKVLNNPISRYYGIGPICLSKLGISRDIADVENIKEDLVNITWEGWIIKSAIIDTTTSCSTSECVI